jgi:hypothetical protein
MKMNGRLRHRVAGAFNSQWTRSSRDPRNGLDVIAERNFKAFPEIKLGYPEHIQSFFYNGSTALCWALAAFSVSSTYTQSVGILGRGSAGRKAFTYTQSNTNTK